MSVSIIYTSPVRSGLGVWGGLGSWGTVLVEAGIYKKGDITLRGKL